MEKGYYRVHLASEEDNDWITAFVPLDEAGRYDDAGRNPHLAKCEWGGATDYGEFIHGKGEQNRFAWAGESRDFLTDFLAVPLEVGPVVRVYEGDTPDYDAWTFVVRDLGRL